MAVSFNEKLVIGIVAFFTLPVVGFFLTWNFQEMQSSARAKESRCKTEIEDSYDGVVSGVYYEFENRGPFTIYFELTDTIRKEVAYGYMVRESRDLFEFSLTGQKVVKEERNDFFTLTNTAGESQQFKTHSCN